MGFQGNGYHPPAWIGPAEYDLKELYEALVNSKQWKDMFIESMGKRVAEALMFDHALTYERSAASPAA